jgi:hypothetical protein
MRNACLRVLIVFAVAMPLLAQDADDPDIKSRIIALERLSRVQAWKARDIKTLSKLLDNDFLCVNRDGKLQTKSDLLASVQSAEIVEYLADQIVVTTHRDTAIATGIYQIRGLIRGKPFLERGRFVDTWLLKNRQWVTIATLSTPTG